MQRRVWGVKVILIREGIVLGWLEGWKVDRVGRSGWLKVVGREFGRSGWEEVVRGGCDWGVGVGSGGVQSGRECVREGIVWV